MQIDLINLDFIDPTLKQIVTELESETGLILTVTSLFRIDDEGVHGTLPLRGVDIRMRDHDIGKLVEEKINDKWCYDPARLGVQCAVFHDIGKGIHLHLQSHPNTVRK